MTGMESVISERCDRLFADDIILWKSVPNIEKIDNEINLTLPGVDFC